MNIEELKNKAEQAWVGCDICDEDDKHMWINGYLAGALANQVELPSNEDIMYMSLPKKGGSHSSDYMEGFNKGAKWVIEQIKQQDGK